MKKNKFFTLTTLFYFLSFFFVQAECLAPGKSFSCDDIPNWYFWILLLVIILMTVFWLWMGVDVFRRKDSFNKVWKWIVLFIPFFGGVVYFFMEKRWK